jgi:hypothetical protein
MVVRPPPEDATQDFDQSALAATLVDCHPNGHCDQCRHAKQDQVMGR